MRTMIGISCAFAVFTAAAAAAAVGFQLRGEVWTNLGGNGGASIRSSYKYDDRGNRILKETRPASESAGPVMGSTEYAYDSLGRPSKTVLKSLDDTLSIVEYRYGAKGYLAVTYTEDKTLKVRLSDSLFYNDAGRLVEARRRAGIELTQKHVFLYDSAGRLASDTVYENQGTAFGPAKAILTSYGSAGPVSGESHYRKVGEDWFLVQTVKMGYAEGKLTSLARYQGDGAGGDLADSTAYTYDFDGNRSHEKGFDGERQPTYAIDFDWLSLNPQGILSPGRQIRAITIRNQAGALLISGQGQAPLVVSLRDVRGNLLRRRTFQDASSSSAEFPWPADLAGGIYLAEAIQGSARYAVAVTRP